MPFHVAFVQAECKLTDIAAHDYFKKRFEVRMDFPKPLRYTCEGNHVKATFDKEEVRRFLQTNLAPSYPIRGADGEIIKIISTGPMREALFSKEADIAPTLP